jgi:recombination protein RecT
MSTLTTKDFFAKDAVKNKFQELLGKRSTGFITSVLQICNNNDLLAKAEPASIFNAAAMAATLDLPINANLGFAYIVPYGGKAQFQMGYKGFIQLAQRSGQVKKIYASEIYEGEISKADPLSGYEFDFLKSWNVCTIKKNSRFCIKIGID